MHVLNVNMHALKVQCDECDWWYHLKCVNKKLEICVAEEDAENIKLLGHVAPSMATIKFSYKFELNPDTH